MTNKKILQEAINKARKNGMIDLYTFEATDFAGYTFVYKLSESRTIRYDFSELIFSHSFAKAFFGTDPVYLESFKVTTEIQENMGWGKNMIGKILSHREEKEAWKYHLQQLVIMSLENRIKYLEKFL